MALARESTNLQQHRVEMRAKYHLDVILPEAATEREVLAQATRTTTRLIIRVVSLVQIGLPDCRLYIYTPDNLN